jgi:hypothetical protein
MLCLIADLKAERDELKRDVDGWRTRVADLESQIGVFAKRVENERREAWVARSRVGLLEVEKATLSKKLDAVDELVALHDKEKKFINDQRTSLKKENEDLKRRLDMLETEFELVKQELELEKSKNLTVDQVSTGIPNSLNGRFGIKKHGLGFMSLDSECSTTDVDSSDDNLGFSLKAVQEEANVSDENDYFEEEENGLAGYEDEEDTDISFHSSSSFSSEDELPRSTHHLISAPTTPTTSSLTQVFTPPQSTQGSRATLGMSWTFPKGVQARTQSAHYDDEDTIDRFFGCLDDDDRSAPNSPSTYSLERSKGIFASGFKFAPADDNASFFLSDDVVLPAVAKDAQERLSAVVEEAEDDRDEDKVDDSEDMFGEIGGIRITFTPAEEEPQVDEAKQLQVSPVKPSSPPPTLPALSFGDEVTDEEDVTHTVVPLNFGRPLANERQPSPPTVAFPLMMTPPSSLPRYPASVISPSSIPRPIVPKPLPSSTESTCLPSKTSADLASLSFSSNSYITPPTKRGGNVPSFIPQAVSSPSPMRVSACACNPRTIPTSTFIRQPVRKPLLSSEVPNAQTRLSGSTPAPITHPLLITPRSQPRLPTRSRK